MVRLTDRPDMTLDVYRGRKTTIQPTNQRSAEVRGKVVMRIGTQQLHREQEL